jgi:hypothetical protein
VIGASKDVLHEPENLEKILSGLRYSTYLDLETNKETHSQAMVDKMKQYISNLQNK